MTDWARGPMRHHRALGIHPGAFVQASPPATADVQDGVLWVDTSKGEPYQLWSWDEALGRWRRVGALLIGPLTDDDTLPCDPCAAITPVPTPTPDPGVDCGPVRCGAAAHVAEWLEEYYARIRVGLNAGVNTAAAFSVGKIVDILAVAFAGSSELVLGGANLKTLGKIAKLLWSNTTTLTLFPALRADDKTAIQRAVYCALPAICPMGPITDATKGQIVANLHKVESSFVALSGALVALLADVPSVQQYQQLAYTGSLDPATTCAAWDCGSHSFTGGAQFGPALGRSMTGGAVFGVALRRSMTGGAQFGIRLKHSTTGGAQLL